MARASRKPTETTTRETRFEFARRHVVKQQKLENELEAARRAKFKWINYDEHGVLLRDSRTRSPRSPEERTHLRELETTILDLRTKLLLHENDGREL